MFPEFFYIIKSQIYIYHIPLLFNAHKNVIDILKSKDIFNFSVSEPIIIERIEFIIKHLSDKMIQGNFKEMYIIN